MPFSFYRERSVVPVKCIQCIHIAIEITIALQQRICCCVSATQTGKERAEEILSLQIGEKPGNCESLCFMEIV